MKLACSTYILPEGSFTERLQYAKDIGFEGVELRIFDDEATLQSDVAELGRALAATGLAPTDLILTGARFKKDVNDGDALAEKLAHARLAVDVAAELGTRPLFTPGLGVKEMVSAYEAVRRLNEAEKTMLLRYITGAMEYAAQKGVKALLEPVNRFETRYYYTLADGADVIRQVGLDGLTLIADTFHINIEEVDAAATIQEHSRYIGHVHLSDNNRLVPGMGHINFAQMYDALAAAGYDGYMALECHVPSPESDLAAFVKAHRPLVQAALQKAGRA